MGGAYAADIPETSRVSSLGEKNDLMEEVVRVLNDAQTFKSKYEVAVKECEDLKEFNSQTSCCVQESEVQIKKLERELGIFNGEKGGLSWKSFTTEEIAKLQTDIGELNKAIEMMNTDILHKEKNLVALETELEMASFTALTTAEIENSIP